jgi:hypothetical protein
MKIQDFMTQGVYRCVRRTNTLNTAIALRNE